VIENAEASFEDSAQVSVRSARIYPSVLHMLTGRLVVRRTLLQEPRLRIHLPESSAKSFDLEDLEKQIRSGLVRFTNALPTPHLEFFRWVGGNQNRR